MPEAVLSLGARPRYVDVEAASPNMDADDLAQKIGPQTRAVVIQHTFGLPADVSRLVAIAREHGVPVVEDCAHTLGSRVDGRRVGSFGVAAFYSFEASKPVFVGIGGSAVCNDPLLAAALDSEYPRYREPSAMVQLQLAAMFLAHRVAYRPSTYWSVRRLFRALVAAGLIRGNYNEVAEVSGGNDHGVDTPAADDAPGGATQPATDFTRRMGIVQAHLLRLALEDLSAGNAHRRWVGSQYRTRIRAPGISHLPVPANVEPVFGRYPIMVDNKAELVEGARDAKVELADFYATPVHPLKGGELRRIGYEPRSCPRAEWIADRIVSLPTGRQVNDRQVERAVRYLNDSGAG